MRREPDNYYGYSDHRPDLALCIEGSLTVFDLKVFDPISSAPDAAGERGAYVAFGNTAERAEEVVLGRRGRGGVGRRATVPSAGRRARATSPPGAATTRGRSRRA